MTTVVSLPSLVELCYQSIAEHLQYNSDAIKVLPVDLTERLIAYMVDRLHPRHLVVTQTRPIKIRLIKQKCSCTFRFLVHGTVGQAIQQIYDKTEDGSLEVQHYGLFQPAGAFRRARWLQEDKFLSYYDIDPSEILDFKSKESTIQIKFLGPWEKVVHPLRLSSIDKTVKTFVVDESKTVGEIAKDIGTKLGLRNADELSLKRQQEEDDVGIWLVPDLTLPEQGVDPLYTTFLLKRLFYFSDEKVSTLVDYDTLHYIFCQCLDAVVAMTHPCSSSDEAVLFAALQCQIGFGDFQPQNHDTFRLKDYLPVEFVGCKGLEREIMSTYQSLAPMSEEKAKVGYIQLTKSLKTYLYTFFRVVKFISKNQTQSCLLGISAEEVLVIDAATRATVDRYRFSQIRKWQVLHSFFSIFLHDHKEEYLTVEAETVSKVLFTHIHHSLRELPMLQKRFGTNYDSVSRSFSRKRVSTDIELLSLEGDLANITDPNVNIYRCPLYLEPKKIFLNLMFGGVRECRENSEEVVRTANKFVRIIRMLTELSHKMIRSISKGGSVGGREREIQVKFSDKKVKTFLVNDKRTVREISHDIGGKLGIKNTDEFSLQLQGSLQAPSSPTASTTPPAAPFYSPMLAPSPHDDESFPYDGPLWLNSNSTLADQDVPETAILLYKKKFYYNDGSEDCNNDPVYYNLLFYQSRDAIISNVYTCNREEAVQLAATLFQINFGDHNPNIHKPGFLKMQDLRFFLPLECLEAWGLTFQKVEKLIYKEHRKLRGIKEVYAKFRYVQLCRSLKTFGAIFFHVRTIKERPHPMLPPPQSVLLGFSRKCILILSAKSKKFISEIPLSHLRRWAYNKSTNIYSLDFGDYEEGCFSFFTTDGEAISQYLADYIDFIQTKLVGSQIAVD